MDEINYLFESELQTRIRTFNYSYDPRWDDDDTEDV